MVIKVPVAIPCVMFKTSFLATDIVRRNKVSIKGLRPQFSPAPTMQDITYHIDSI